MSNWYVSLLRFHPNFNKALSESFCCLPDGQVFTHEENQSLEYQDVLKTLWVLRDEPGQPI